MELEQKPTLKVDYPRAGWFTVYDIHGVFVGSWRSIVIANKYLKLCQG